MNPETNPASQTPPNVLNELRAVLAETKAVLAQHRSPACCGDALHEIREQFAFAQQQLGKACDDTKQILVNSARATDAAVRANPYQSLAVAFGAGVALGVWLGRDDRQRLT